VPQFWPAGFAASQRRPPQNHAEARTILILGRAGFFCFSEQPRQVPFRARNELSTAKGRERSESGRGSGELESLGLDRSYLTGVERGKRNVSTVNSEVIAEGFAISLGGLLSRV
jgi:hypothetical protein